MKEINSKLKSSGISIFGIMSELARKHKAINLGQGFPNFDCPKELRDLVSFHLNDGKNQYCPMPGLLELRKMLSEKILKLYSKNINPETEITITAGATQAIFTTITALIDSGDEVIIIEPAYDSYRPSIQLSGGKVVPYELKAPEFKIDWDELKLLITSKTKMIITNNPQNPIGKIMDEGDLKALDDIVIKHDLFLLSDEVYEHLTYDNLQHQSVLRYPNLFERSICTYSFGKTFHNTGWKMGYCVAPEYIMKEIRKVHQWNVFSVNSFVQYALADFLKNEDHYLSLSKFYQEKRDFLQEGLKGSRLRPLPCNGTYFQLYDYSEISPLDDLEFAKSLVIDHGVASIPVSAFYQSRRQNKVIRLCFAKTEETLAEAAKVLSSI